jgi:hypothetical protein
MILIIFNPVELPDLPREHGDAKRKIRISGSFRHTHEEIIRGDKFFELENDTEVGKVSLYLNRYELEALCRELPDGGGEE